MKLFETIKCKDGKLFNLKFHQKRFNNARKEKFGRCKQMLLTEQIQIPEKYKKGLFRCRVTYSEKIEKIEFITHQYKKVESLKLVVDDTIDYHLKYIDRKHLNELYENRGSCDDILIIKNGCISDSWTANPIFFDGDKWWTTDTPLLPGTQRLKLISEHRLSICRVTPSDFKKYKKVGLINAMQDLDNMPVIAINNIEK